MSNFVKNQGDKKAALKSVLTQLSPATFLNFFSRYKTTARIKVTIATIRDPRAAVPK